MQTKPILNKRKLFAEWVLTNTIGMILAIPIATMLATSIPSLIFGIIEEIFTLIIKRVALPIPQAELEYRLLSIDIILQGILFAIIPSILLGVFQWIVLRKQIADSKNWILVSSIGLSIGLSISIFGGDSLIFNRNQSSISLGILSGGIGAIIGATLGIAQWFFLRKHVKYSSLWVLGSIISCSIATNIEWGWPSFLRIAPGDDTGTTIIIGFIVLLIRLLVIYSIVSGIMLTWMLEHPTKELQMENTA